MYLPKQRDENACEFCGNQSDERDMRGNCVGCGGPRRPPQKSKSSRRYGNSEMCSTVYFSDCSTTGDILENGIYDFERWTPK
jgi:hypothetical protein